MAYIIKADKVRIVNPTIEPQVGGGESGSSDPNAPEPINLGPEGASDQVSPPSTPSSDPSDQGDGDQGDQSGEPSGDGSQGSQLLSQDSEPAPGNQKPASSGKDPQTTSSGGNQDNIDNKSLNKRTSDMKEKIKNALKDPDSIDQDDHHKDPYNTDLDNNDKYPALKNAESVENQESVVDTINQAVGESTDQQLKDNVEKSSNSSSSKDAANETLAGDTPDSGLNPEFVKHLNDNGIKTKKKGNWRVMLKRLVLQSLGYDDVWSTERPSRKLKGAFGAEIEEPAFKSIGIIMDASGSMSIELYEKAIRMLQDIVTKAHLSRLQTNVLVFANTSIFKKFAGYNKAKVTSLFQTGKGGSIGGGTDFEGALTKWNMKVKQPVDVLLVFSDMQFYDPPRIKSLTKRYKHKMIWVAVNLTENAMGTLKQIDSGVKNKLVIVT